MSGPNERAPAWHYENEAQPDGSLIRRPVLDDESRAELGRVMAESELDSLDAARAEAEAALPEDGDTGFTIMMNPRTRQYAAWVWGWDDPPGMHDRMIVDTLAAALRALAAKLREA